MNSRYILSKKAYLVQMTMKAQHKCFASKLAATVEDFKYYGITVKGQLTSE